MRASPPFRFRLIRLGPCLALTLIAAACAPVTQAPPVDPESAKAEAEKQRLLVVERYVADLRRLNAIAFRIFAANADFCREKGKSAGAFGFKVGNAYSFPKDFEAGARRVVGGRGLVRIVAVAPGSPAGRAGMREGDAVLALDGTPAPKGENEAATRDFGKQLAEQVKTGNPIVFRVQRENEEVEFALHPVAACAYGYGIDPKEIVNASADGKSVQITSGMMRFAETDEELATVVGHELAHNLMGHIDSKRGNIALGFLVDLLFAGFGVNTGGVFSDMAGQSYSQEFETEADYVGLYLMARAGYDIAGSPNFWRRMGVRNPGSIRTNHAASHPSAPYRFVSLDKTVEEIERKKAAGLPLRPEMKAEPVPAAAPAGN